MDKTINIDNIKPEEFKDFIEKIAGVGGSKLISQQGYKYVDNVEFWKWMKNSYPKVFNEGLSNWLNRHPMYGEKLIQGKGAEWDYIRMFNNNPQNQSFHIPFDKWKTAKLSKDVTGKADAYIRHLASGSEMPVQVKTATTDNSIKSVLRTLEDKYPGHKIVANEKLAVEARKVGVANPIAHISDKQLAKATQDRVGMAKSGAVSAGDTIAGVAKEIGYGAVVGTVIQASISMFTNYRQWKNGEITRDEFRNAILKDSAYGATTGGAIAGINVVIQSIAIPAGIGAPITLPVLILAGYGLDKLIAPAFGRGAYKEVLQDISLCTDVQDAFVKFVVNSYGCQRYFMDWLREMGESHKIYKQLEDANIACNDEMKNICSKLVE